MYNQFFYNLFLEYELFSPVSSTIRNVAIRPDVPQQEFIIAIKKEIETEEKFRYATNYSESIQ
jgi:hypothetical protein